MPGFGRCSCCFRVHPGTRSCPPEGWHPGPWSAAHASRRFRPPQGCTGSCSWCSPPAGRCCLASSGAAARPSGQTGCRNRTTAHRRRSACGPAAAPRWRWSRAWAAGPRRWSCRPRCSCRHKRPGARSAGGGCRPGPHRPPSAHSRRQRACASWYRCSCRRPIPSQPGRGRSSTPARSRRSHQRQLRSQSPAPPWCRLPGSWRWRAHTRSWGRFRPNRPRPCWRPSPGAQRCGRLPDHPAGCRWHRRSRSRGCSAPCRSYRPRQRPAWRQSVPGSCTCFRSALRQTATTV